MRLRGLALGVLIGAGACVSSAAVAQEQMPTVQAKRLLKFGARATGTYDSNVSRSSPAIATLRNLQLKDYLFTPGASLSYTQPFGRQVAYISADGGYTFYKRNTQLNSVRGSVNGGVLTTVGICKQAIVAGYRVAQNELSNIDVGKVNNLQEATNLGLGLQCATPQGLGGQVFAQRTDTFNSVKIRRDSDTTTEMLSTQLQYGRPSLGTFSLGFSYAGVEFPNRITPGRPVGDGFFTQGYSLGYQRQFGKRLSVTGTGARTFLKREFAPTGVDQSFSSNTYSLDATSGLGSRIDFSAHLARAITPSQQLGKTYDKSTQKALIANYRPGRTLSFSAGVSRQNIDSNLDTAVQIGPVVTSARTDSVFGSMTYSPNKTWSLVLNVRQEDRKANLPDFNYTSTRVGLTAQASF